MTRPSSSPSSTALEAVPMGVGRAHAKTILIGEHAVVYGAPAIALPVHGLATRAELWAAESWSLDCDLHRGPVAEAPPALAPVVTAWRQTARRVGSAPSGRLRLISEIPMQRGLGSSAAVAAAVVDAVGSASAVDLGLADRIELVQRAETVAHGKASGIDTAAVLSNTPILFERGATSPVAVGARFAFVVADTGVPSSTATAVGGVRSLRGEQPDLVDGLVGHLSELARVAVVSLQRGDATTLGTAMNEAHESLNRLGVGSDDLDRLVEAARGAGALGAKLTGGGLGGCILALARAADLTRLQQGLRTAGARGTWTTILEGTA